MNMEELLRKLNITEQPTKDGDSLIVNIMDSDDYARVYAKLDKSDLVEELEESSQITLENSSIQYESVDGKYNLTLLADFDGDIYTLVIKEN